MEHCSVKLTRVRESNNLALTENVDNSILFLSQSAFTAEIVKWEPPITQRPVSMAIVIKMIVIEMMLRLSNSLLSIGGGGSRIPWRFERTSARCLDLMC